MREFEERRRFKRFLYSKWVASFLLLILIFLAVKTWEVYEKERESARKRAEINNELKSLEDRQKALTKEIKDLQTPQGIEREIREKFRVAREGEELVIIIDEKATSSETKIERRWWQFWK